MQVVQHRAPAHAGQGVSRLGMGRDQSRTLAGLGVFVANAAAYGLALAGVIAFPWWPARLLCAASVGVALATLLAVGHDAAHNSLTPSRRLNAVLGRLSLLPALHPYSVWRAAHLRGHHDFTNLRGMDYVWTPLSKQEYDALPLAARLLQRAYRTAAGVGLYYLVEIWCKNAFTENGRLRVKGLNRAEATLDRLLVAAFALAQGWTLCVAHGYAAAWFDFSPLPAAALLTLAMGIPFLVFCWITGFVTFLHHTHPDVRWYARREEWSFYQGAVLGTTHVVFPWYLRLLLHNIMDHAAHHVDPRIPLYGLAEGQRQLEARYPGVVVEEFSVAGFLRTLAACRLYDYEAHRWLDFDGRPTSPATG